MIWVPRKYHTREQNGLPNNDKLISQRTKSKRLKHVVANMLTWIKEKKLVVIELLTRRQFGCFKNSLIVWWCIGTYSSQIIKDGNTVNFSSAAAACHLHQLFLIFARFGSLGTHRHHIKSHFLFNLSWSALVFKILMRSVTEWSRQNLLKKISANRDVTYLSKNCLSDIFLMIIKRLDISNINGTFARKINRLPRNYPTLKHPTPMNSSP